MKQIYKYIAILFVGMIAFSACTDENEFQDVGVVEEGHEVTLTLSLQPETNKQIVNSRATADENKLYDLHFYVFNSSGKLTGYEKLVSETGEIASPGLPNAIPVTIRTKTGTSYIYAVANINSGSTYNLSATDNALLNVTPDATGSMTESAVRAAVDASSLNRTNFLGINYIRSYSTGDNQNFTPNPVDNKFMMSGYLNDGNSVTIQKAGNVVSIKENVNVVKLYRILAKNTLTIETVGNGTFTPKSYRLCNVPVGGQLIPNVKISTANTETTYTSNNITNANVESRYQLSTTNTSFTFYYPENLQSSITGISAWKDREKNSWSEGSNSVKSFTNAPVNAAYVEIQGDYIDKTQNITANVSYTIHLGNFTKSLGDFNVIRNNHYIYNVKVKGVNDIIAEAKLENNADNSYAEGLVIKVGSGQHFDVDAHYEARVLKFTKASIQALKNSHANRPGYILNVSTPFGKTAQTVNVKSDGVYSMNDELICTIEQATDIDNPANAEEKAALFQDEADFRWMKFVRNTTSNCTKTGNDISLYTCKYPGDNNEKEESYGRWLNVFELLAQLYNDNIYTENNGTEAYYTCFIDENYYANKEWKNYVNKDPRSMQIANNLYISTDEKSVYAEVAYSISQRSITTFYTNTNIRAFGTEIIDEEDKYNSRLGSRTSKLTYYENLEPKNQHDWDAYTSAIATNSTKNWYENDSYTVTTQGNRPGSSSSTTTTVIETVNKEGIQPLYKAAAKACMSRNRDLNGDGSIQNDEIRWYLAAIDQYRALYYSKAVLAVDALLISKQDLQDIDDAHRGGNSWYFMEDKTVRDDQYGHNARAYYHYWTCSEKTKSGTFWPEEGLTNNPVRTSWDSRAELVRCIRTLESEDVGLDNPQLFYEYNSASRTFNMNGIKVSRNFIDGALPIHNETEELNDFYTSFVVAKNDLNGTYSNADVANAQPNNDPCKNYKTQNNVTGTDEANYDWRSPNQKEMAIMLSQISSLKEGNYITRTKFSGYDSARGYYDWHTQSPAGFGSENGSINLTPITGKLRCVRDNK